MTQLETDTSKLQEYIQELADKAPSVLREAKRRILFGIGDHDIGTLRAGILTRLKIKQKGAEKAYKRVVEDDNTLSENSMWKGAGTLDRGGVSRSAGPLQLVWTDEGRKWKGRKKSATVRDLITQWLKDGKFSFIKRIGRPALLVRHNGKQNKKGGFGKNARVVVYAVMRKTTAHKAGLVDINANSAANAPQHEIIMSKAMDKAVDNSPLVDKK
jgi:hypothetical protein